MEYRSPKTLSIAAMCALGACGFVQFILAIAGLVQAFGPAVPLRGSGSSIPILIETFLGSAYSLLYIATAVLFIVWLYRAHKNLQFLHPDLLEFSDAAAIGWWFAPIFSLFRPFQVVREVWAESEPEFDPDALHLSANLHTAPGYMVAWWIAFIVMGIAGNVETLASANINTLTLNSFGLVILTDGLISAVGAGLAIRVVKDTSDRQDARHRLLNRVVLEQLPPPPPIFEEELA